MPKIMLSPNDPSFFEPVLSPNAPACRSAGLTPVSISYLTAPPGDKFKKIFLFLPELEEQTHVHLKIKKFQKW